MNLFFILFVISICLMCIEASSTRESRITGAYEARPNSNPYVVALVVKYQWRRYRHCTGSILSERWILSSGYCVTDSRSKWYAMDAIGGAHNLEKVSSSMVYPISDRIAHPMYRGGVSPYDISMLKTSRSIEFSEKVQPIELPTSAPGYNMDEDLLITGWGAIKRTFFTTVIPNNLREADVTYLPFNECYRAIDRIKNSYDANPLQRYHNLCTGLIAGGIKGGCTGDSGGPLVQYIPVPNATETTSEREETSTAMSSSTTPGSTFSPTPMTTDRTSTTSESTTTPQSTISPTPMTTDRTSTTSESTTTPQSTISPTPMTTDRTSTTSESTTTPQSTISPTPMTTDRTSTTSESTTTPQSTISPTPMTTDRTSTTSESTTTPQSTISPTPMTTDRTSTTSESTTTPQSTISPTPMTTDRTSTTSESTTTPQSTISPTPMTTDRTFTTSESTTTPQSTISPTPMTTDRTSSTTTATITAETTTSYSPGIIRRSFTNSRALNDKMMPTVVGVISWGVVPCGIRGSPAVYSNVTNYLDFINAYLGS